jgi:hypothetical protein
MLRIQISDTVRGWIPIWIRGGGCGYGSGSEASSHNKFKKIEVFYSFYEVMLLALKQLKNTAFDRPYDVGKVRGWPSVPIAGVAVRISSRLHLRGRRMWRQARCMRFLSTKKTQHVEAVLPWTKDL